MWVGGSVGRGWPAPQGPKAESAYGGGIQSMRTDHCSLSLPLSLSLGSPSNGLVMCTDLLM